MSSESDKTSLAALISVQLRRQANRVIDIKWLITNKEYAREIINLCNAQGQDDLAKYAQRFESMMFGTDMTASADSKTFKMTENTPQKATTSDEEVGADEAAPTEVEINNYVGHLR